jgi:Carboxypeptidase regulatory-like domain/TonB dependent receptor
LSSAFKRRVFMKSVLKMARVRQGVCVLGVTLGVLLCSLPLFSQGSNGRILGTVADQTGGVISGATVTIIDKDRGVARTLTTDDAGEYNAPQLVPSTYIVRAEAKGFKKLERQNIVLEVGKEVRVDLTVQPGEQTQTVTVTEAIPLVETTNATLGGTLANEQIIDIPLNGRNYQNLLGLRPGVILQPGGSPWTQSTNGARPDETAWMVEGVINVTFYDARPVSGTPSAFTDGATILPIDAIQEFNLMENPKAEYGWKPGAVVNVGLKSGTNNLHGTAYAFGRDQALDARNAFNPNVDPTGTCPLNPDPTAGVCNKAPAQLEQFGGTVGGPIKKDKLFFFAGYEGLRSNIGNIFSAPFPSRTDMANAITAVQGKAGYTGICTAANNGTTPCLSPTSLALLGCSTTGPAATGTYSCLGGGSPGPNGTFVPSTSGLFGMQHDSLNNQTYASNFINQNTSDNGVAKIAYRINDKHSIDGSVIIGNYSAIGEDHTIVNSNWRDTYSPIRAYTYTGNWIWTPNSTWVNDLRVGYDRITFVFLPADTNLAVDGKNYPLNSGITSTGGFPTVYLGGGSGFGTAGGLWLGSWRGRPTVTGPSPYEDFQDSISYLRGKHSFKFGGEFAHIQVDSYNYDTRGRFDLTGGNCVGASSCPSLQNLFSGKFKDLQQLVGASPRKLTWTSTAGFIQDDYRLTPKLMINLGLRYSYVSPFKEANNLLANFDPTAPTGLVQQGQPGVATILKPDYKDFSPRLGFAWDVTGKGTTVVRGGGSIIYSSWQMASFLGNPGIAGGHDKSTALAANPTGFACTVGIPGCPASGNFGGTITTGNVIFPSKGIHWDNSPTSAGYVSGGAVPNTPPSCGAPTGSTGVCDLFAVDPNLRYPYVVNWSLGVTHAFNSNLSLEVGYVGNHGTQLMGLRDLNQGEVVNGVTITDAKGNPILPYASQFPFRYINYASNDSKSVYNGLQATLTQRVTHGLSFTSGYTYSHALDDGSLNRFGALPANSYNVLAEYGNADLDVRHHWTFTASYDIPGRKGFAQLLQGWKLNTVVTLQSGLPWGAIDTGNNIANTGLNGGEETDRWDFFGNPADFKSGSSSIPYCTGPLAGGCTATSGITGLVTSFSGAQSTAMWNQCVAHAADPAGTLGGVGCFVDGNSVMTPPALNHFGNMGRNIFHDSGFKDWDFSLFKAFKFTERFGAQFRVEVFNLLNTVNVANPYGAAAGGLGNDPSTAGKFGCGCTTPDVGNGNALIGSGSGRVMQLGLKLSF